MKNPLPLFPLQMVLFPGATLALTVFEARYLDLVADCLREQEPFGVICLQQGAEAGRSKAPVKMESVGTLAHIEEVDAEQTGILRLRCVGGQRFRITAPPEQKDNGLWTAPVQALPADALRAPGPAVQATVTALAEAIRKLQTQDQTPFATPHRLDEAGWVANRWCELLPIPMGAKQKLMALDEPVLRLTLVDEYLRGKGLLG